MSDIPNGLKQSLGYLLNKAARTLREQVNDNLKPMSLGINEYIILRLIELKLADTQQAVGQRYDIDRTSMVELVDRLEARELLMREKNPLDRRSYRLVLTPKGRKTLSAAKRVAEKVQKRFLEPLADQEVGQLKEILWKLIDTSDR